MGLSVVPPAHYRLTAAVGKHTPPFRRIPTHKRVKFKKKKTPPSNTEPLHSSHVAFCKIHPEHVTSDLWRRPRFNCRTN